MNTDTVTRARAYAAALLAMEASGTPGPWAMYAGGNFTRVTVDPACWDREHSVCEMKSHSPQSDNAFGEDYVAEQANARLICAARNTLRASVGCVLALCAVATCHERKCATWALDDSDPACDCAHAGSLAALAAWNAACEQAGISIEEHVVS